MPSGGAPQQKSRTGSLLISAGAWVCQTLRVYEETTLAAANRLEEQRQQHEEQVMSVQGRIGDNASCTVYASCSILSWLVWKDFYVHLCGGCRLSVR